MTEPCWEWTGYLNEYGYGRINSVKNQRGYVHRLVYAALVGPIPDDLVCDHLCRNSACCNPAHIELVTQAENVRRGNAGINSSVKTHCPQGHDYSGKDKRGRRICHTCRAAWNRAARKKEKESST